MECCDVGYLHVCVMFICTYGEVWEEYIKANRENKYMLVLETRGFQGLTANLGECNGDGDWLGWVASMSTNEYWGHLGRKKGFRFTLGEGSILRVLS